MSHLWYSEGHHQYTRPAEETGTPATMGGKQSKEEALHNFLFCKALQAEGKGVEPSTACAAPDFESAESYLTAD